MAPNTNHNFDAVASADTSVDGRINHNNTNDTPHPEHSPNPRGYPEGSFTDSKLPAAASSHSHITTTTPSQSSTSAMQQHVPSSSPSHHPESSNRGHHDYRLPLNGKRKHSSSTITAEPDTEAGLELLFAASLIQQNDDCHKQQAPSAKTISSCSENESTHGDSPLHTSAALTESADVLEPSDRDVLCGRGGFINKHTGNIVYRKVVDYNKAIYKQVPKRHRILVSQSIVQTIEKHGGRFLQLVGGQPVGGQSHQVWKCIQFRRAVQKTSQALREPSADAMECSSAADQSTASPKRVK
eukprot:scaffold1328_cov162-Amphora_coffeaeformis.AAC.11